MKRIAVAVLLTGLLTGCMGDRPLLPELKGRWAASNAAVVRYALLTRTPTEFPQPDATAVCRTDFITFEKKRIALHSRGETTALFSIRAFKRDGSRLILTGDTPLPSGKKTQLTLVLEGDTVRFTDIIDRDGRSLKGKQLNYKSAKRAAVNTVNDIFQPTLNVKRCAENKSGRG